MIHWAMLITLHSIITKSNAIPSHAIRFTFSICESLGVVVVPMGTSLGLYLIEFQLRRG